MSNLEELTMSKVFLLMHCPDIECNHGIHIAVIENELDVVPTQMIVGRLGKRAMKMLNVFNDSDTFVEALKAIAKPFDGDVWNQPQMFAKDFPYINKEDVARAIRPIIDAMQQPDKSDDSEMEVGKPFENTASHVDAVVTDELKIDHRDVVDFVPHPSLTPLDAAHARVAHYQSENLRLQALRISTDLKHS